MRRRTALTALAAGLLSASEAMARRPVQRLRLFARLSVTPRARRDGEVRVVVELSNQGVATAAFSQVPFASPVTCLEVQDAGGQRVATVSPPVPRPDSPDDIISLEPQATRSFEFTLAMFSPPLPPGRYTVRMRPGLPFDGLPASFEIRR